MRKVLTSLAVLAIVACNKPADTANDMNAADESAAMDNGMAMDANMVAPAGMQINETSWEFTRDGKPITETIDANGNYVAWSGTEHIDHGTAVMKEDKACFTSAMDKEGEVCWTTSPTEVAVGQSFETTSDKGENLTVTRLEFMAVPAAVAP